MDIDWTTVLEHTPQVVNLQSTEIDEAHDITFHETRLTEDGHIVATVSSETLEGTTIWLKGKFGAQNGLGSLIKACDGDGSKIEGNTFTFTRVESEKSPAGYAYRWVK